MPLPAKDFDPTESAIPWSIFESRHFEVQMATPQGLKPECDQRMITGQGLGLLAPFLMADDRAQKAYQVFEQINADAQIQNDLDHLQFHNLIDYDTESLQLLFEELRKERLRISREENVPAYEVFYDKT